MRLIKISFILLLFTQTGCVDDFSFPLPFDEPQLYADVLVSSNAEASSITLGWTNPLGEKCYFFSGGTKYESECLPEISEGPYKVTGSLVLLEHETGKRYDYPVKMEDKKRYIQFNPDIKGTPGYHYTLRIEIIYNNQSTYYHSETTMQKTPPIEKTSYVIRKGNVGKEDKLVPLIHFNEPQDTRDYYLLSYLPNRYSSETFWYSVIDDNFLPDLVDGLSIDDGASVKKYAEWYMPPYPNEEISVALYSVDKITYDFYKALIHQYNNTGGAYSSMPATPKGNIEGGAIGLFRALDESRGTIIYE